MRNSTLTITLPSWIKDFNTSFQNQYPSLEERMDLAIQLAHRNIIQETGGPFAAAVFCEEDRSLLSVGINLVTSLQASCAHAEILALTFAQRALKTYSLAHQHTGQHYQLVTTVAPCAMCLGAIPWSGIHSIVCGARGRDAEEVGFNEGLKPHHWAQRFQAEQGITVIEDIQREQARQVLKDYRTRGGVIY